MPYGGSKNCLEEKENIISADTAIVDIAPHWQTTTLTLSYINKKMNNQIFYNNSTLWKDPLGW